MRDNIYNKDLVSKIPSDLQNHGSVDINVRSLAGYAKAPFKGKETQLFYWFFESQKFHPEVSRNDKEIEETPLIIWLNGGPGAPSTLGLFLENGPYKICDVYGEIIDNEYSWNKEAHIMYWDQPIGTGYSNIKDESPQVTFAKSEDDLSETFYYALQDFLTMHPEYRSCPVYISGESYGGKYVPNIALKIHNKNMEEKNPEKLINLKGISVGDGWINSRLQMKVYIDYAFNMGYLDTHQQEEMLADYSQFCDMLDKEDWNSAYTKSNNLVDNISALGGGFNVYNITRFSEISMKNVQAYMEMDDVKKALHVPIEQKWNCADNKGPVAENLIEDNMEDSSSVYTKLICHDNKYEVLMYTGTFDTACGSSSTELILYNLEKWKDAKDNEAWKNLQRKIWAQPHNLVKGFIKQFKNLTQIVLPNSGHQVPYYKPEISRDMIYKWIKTEPFPSYNPTLKKDQETSVLNVKRTI